MMSGIKEIPKVINKRILHWDYITNMLHNKL